MISIRRYGFFGSGRGSSLSVSHEFTQLTTSSCGTPGAPECASSSACLDMGDLPGIEVDVGRDCLAREIRLAALGVARQGFELLADLGLEPDGHGGCFWPCLIALIPYEYSVAQVGTSATAARGLGLRRCQDRVDRATMPYAKRDL